MHAHTRTRMHAHAQSRWEWPQLAAESASLEDEIGALRCTLAALDGEHPVSTMGTPVSSFGLP